MTHNGYMKRVTILLNSGEHINIPADRLEYKENTIIAWHGNELVAYADVGAVICAYLSEKG